MFIKDITTSVEFQRQMYEWGLDVRGWMPIKYWQKMFDSRHTCVGKIEQKVLEEMNITSSWWIEQIRLGNLKSVPGYKQNRTVYFVHDEWVKECIRKWLEDDF